MGSTKREVMLEVFEFVLSLFIISVSAFMIYKGVAVELFSGVITLVTGYWFTKQSNTSAVNTAINAIKNPNVQTAVQAVESLVQPVQGSQVSKSGQPSNPTNSTVNTPQNGTVINP